MTGSNFLRYFHTLYISLQRKIKKKGFPKKKKGNMGRSNNQLRRTAKATGKAYIPKATKSKAKNLARKQQMENAKKHRKLSYGKMRNKSGKVVDRKFRSGGYNSSGKFGRAAGAKRMVGKK